MTGEQEMILIEWARPLGVTALAGGLLLLAACGGGDGGTTAATPKTSASASADPRAAFRQCLQQHGVTLPNQGGGAPSGRPGQIPSVSASQRQALQACASLAPNGGGFGNGGDQSALKAFQNCMDEHGVKVTSTFRPGELRTSDPKAAAAFRTCRALLPGRATPAPGSS
jgi:hypothetical protein